MAFFLPSEAAERNSVCTYRKNAIAGGEELLRIGARLAAAAERGRRREVQINAAIGAAHVAVAAVVCGHFCGVERLDEGEHGSMVSWWWVRPTGRVLVRFA